MLDLHLILNSDLPVAVQAAHADLSRSARADESFYLHETGGSWRCERFPGGDSESVTADGVTREWLAARGARSVLEITLGAGRHIWRWYLGRKSAEPFTEAERAAAEARFAEWGPALALRDAVQDGDTARDQIDLILNNSADAIIVVDAENKIRLFNGAASEIFGYGATEVLGTDYDLLLPPELREKGEAGRIRRLVEQKGASQDEECLRWSKDGKPLALKVRWAAIKKPEGALVSHISFIRDMRPIKRLREELVRAQSLAMIGELAASVAHEVRNPLASIQAAIENLREELKPSGGHDEMFKKIVAQVQRLDDTVEHLLIFAKPWEVAPREYDLAGVIQAVTNAARREPDSRYVQFDVSCPVPSLVVGDPQLVEQVLINVIRNAAQAMQGSGRVELKVGLTDSAVEIVVRDAGPGIPPDHQTKIFRPFFTMKSQGTGLGLPTCQKILQAHRGSIKITNIPGGRGAEVAIRLPRIYR